MTGEHNESSSLEETSPPPSDLPELHLDACRLFVSIHCRRLGGNAKTSHA